MSTRICTGAAPSKLWPSTWKSPPQRQLNALSMTGPPTVDFGAVTATGATSGAPGYFTPTGATTPANLAALSGITATPSATWAAGAYVITADLLANNWNGTTWVAGKHP